MRKISTIVLLVTLVLFAKLAYCEENYDFRSSVWGMTKEEVKEAEGEVNWETPNTVYNSEEYKTKVLNFDCSACFYFDDQDKLRQGSIWFYISHTTDYMYYSDFLSVSSALSEKYGEPTNQIENWTSDYYKDSPGTAILLGQLSLITDWSTDTTMVRIGMIGDNYNVQFAIFYYDLKTPYVQPSTGL